MPSLCSAGGWSPRASYKLGKWPTNLVTFLVSGSIYYNDVQGPGYILSLKKKLSEKQIPKSEVTELRDRCTYNLDRCKQIDGRI